MRRFSKIFLMLLIVMVAAIGSFSALGNGISFGGEDGGTTGRDARLRAELPSVDLNDWALRLVNAQNTVEPDFYVATATTSDGYLFDERAAAQLDAMLSAGREKGMKLVLTSAYRTYDYQSGLYENKVSALIDEMSLTRERAEQEAASVVARPGTSEHNIGLAADIVCEYYSILDEGYANTAEAVWLRENCAEYGFILRYTADKQHLTGIISEPWHFRYVGVEAARYIMDTGICLEEFIELVSGEA